MKSNTYYEQVGGYLSAVVFSLRPTVTIFELLEKKQLKLSPAWQYTTDSVP